MARRTNSSSAAQSVQTTSLAPARKSLSEWVWLTTLAMMGAVKLVGILMYKPLVRSRMDSVTIELQDRGGSSSVDGATGGTPCCRSDPLALPERRACLLMPQSSSGARVPSSVPCWTPGLDMIAHLLRVERCSVMLLDGETGELTTRNSRGIGALPPIRSRAALTANWLRWPTARSTWRSVCSPVLASASCTKMRARAVS